MGRGEKHAGYEKFLKTNEDVERIRPFVEKKLSSILKRYDQIIVVAGKRYRQVLRNLWDLRFVAARASGYANLAKMVKDAIPPEKTLPSFEDNNHNS